MCYRHVWARLYHLFSPAALDRQKSAQTLLPTLCQSGNEPAMLTSLGWLVTIAGHSHLSKVLQNFSCFTLKSCRHFGTKLKSKPPFLPRTMCIWMTNNCHGQIFAYCLDTELQCWQSSKGFFLSTQWHKLNFVVVLVILMVPANGVKKNNFALLTLTWIN